MKACSAAYYTGYMKALLHCAEAEEKKKSE